MKQVYIEGLYGRLIPVKVLRQATYATNCFRVRALEGIHGYDKGEEADIGRVWLVHKAGYLQGRQQVISADLSAFETQP